MEQTKSESTQKYKQCLNEILMGTDSLEIANLLRLEHVFEFIQKNIRNIDKTVHITDILPILDYSIRWESQSGGNRTMHLGNKILALFEADEELQKACGFFYQILQTLSPEDKERFIIGDEVFCVLMQHLLSEDIKPLIKANILACFQLYARKFKAPHILATLWQNIEMDSHTAAENHAALQILITLFDDFAGCEHIKSFKETMQTTNLIGNLIKSEEHDKRKCGYFLLKKLFSISSGTPHFWTTCISIFENLEENQSHLILPSLELLKNLKPKSDQEINWLNILHHRILLHNNILVRRWVLEYFLEHQTFDELPVENAVQLMRSLNETTLYNIEGYMLPTKHIKRFVAKSIRKFLQILCQINWKAVPLHFWMSQLLELLQEVKLNELSERQKDGEELLLNLASKIRALQNVCLRRHIIELYNQLFATPLACMDLVSYVELMKSLYNISDPFSSFELLHNKFEKLSINAFSTNSNFVFDQRFYEIFTNVFIVPHNQFSKPFQKMVLQKLEGIDCVCQGYLSFLVIFDFEESPGKQAFCLRNYDLDMLSLAQKKNFNDIYGLLCERIGNALENKTLLRQKAMDFYVCNTKHFPTFSDLQNCNFKLDEILNAGSNATLLRLAVLLAAHEETVQDNVLESLLNSLREHLKNKHICFAVVPCLLKYYKKVLNRKNCAFWTKKLLELDLENVYIARSILLDGFIEINDEEFLLEQALNGDVKTGDSRIEEAYMKKFSLNYANGCYLRYNYVHQITTLESTKLKKSILIRVCEMAKELNLKKPRYFANSKEHRMLTRITYLLWSLKTTELDWKTANQQFEKLWSLLLDHNNQPNVTIIYECLIAEISTFTALMDKIKTLQREKKRTSSQEVSMIMLLYRYFEKHYERTSPKEYSDAINFLWPLTMGSSFQTRLYAQLVVGALIEQLEQRLIEKRNEAFEIQTFIQLKMAIEVMIGKTQIEGFLKDFRFTPISTNDFYNEVMYLTQMPYDEYQKAPHHFHNEHNLPSKKLIETAKGEILMDQNQKGYSILINSCVDTDVQRKLNPTADFLPQSNLIYYPSYKDHELYVIASFVDKIPNLGGIARTCEVLGIGNLVLASKADLAKADFKNLSMTAEKTLNIIEVKPSNLQEFLIQKKNEGFVIIGAEQTSKSHNFAEFEFPKRSLLLLGHEKEGIPPNFLGFLDYAVEIPQFGMVRSLNVHVTGALFMWEYCKQHIYKTNLLKNKT